MDKIARIRKELLELEEQKEKAAKLIIESNQMISQNKLDLAHCYKEFFDRKNKMEFVLYDRFPSSEIFKLHITRTSDRFPMHESGVLDVKELAEVIKHFYQFQKGKQYNILTIGVSECAGDPIYGGQSFSVKPHVYFVVGSDSQVEPFREFDGKYINDGKLYTSLYLYTAKRKMDFISIELENGYIKHNDSIECLTGEISDVKGGINYYDYEEGRYKSFATSSEKNIFDSHLLRRALNEGKYGYEGIKSVMNFDSHIFDTFISKMLISVAIYKRNNNIEELSEEDYNHIFDVLFKEKVDIKNEVKKDIPKQLIYVPYDTNK